MREGMDFKYQMWEQGATSLDVAHALATPLLRNDFDVAAFAGDALIADLLVFSAVALVVLDRAEDLFTEQTGGFRLLGTVVDGFGFEDLAFRPRTDVFRRSETDLDGGEIVDVERTIFAAARLFDGGRREFAFGGDGGGKSEFISHVFSPFLIR